MFECSDCHASEIRGLKRQILVLRKQLLELKVDFYEELLCVREILESHLEDHEAIDPGT